MAGSTQSLRTNLQSLGPFLILLLAAILRFYQLDASSLWSDEGNTWVLLSRSFTEIAHAAAADIHPPGYYWLLKIWTALPGHTAAAMRSFSAVSGILLVWIIYRLTLRACTPIKSEGRDGNLQSTIRNPQSIALLAAFLAAINPFQVYYSQEARMYMLLALESAGLFWALLALIQQNRVVIGLPTIGFVLCGIAGLWTHYSFPIVLAAADVAYLYFVIEQSARGEGQSRITHYALRNILVFILLNVIILLTFLPWLPIALEQVRNWPKGGEEIGLLAALGLTIQTLIFGPLRNLLAPLWPWLLLTTVLPLLGLYTLRRSIGGVPLALWLLAPILLLFGLGLYSDAFLKFLLIASPAWCSATAAATSRETRRQGGPEGAPATGSRWQAINLRSLIANLQFPLIALAAIVLAWEALPAYYTDPAARDNYAGVARYIQSVGDPVRDLIILDAPGQQEVWRYYDPGFAVLALPEDRPPDPDQTIAALAHAVADRRQIFALFWATDEADPERLVERWLDQHAFKGLESWQGNLRFVTYSLTNHLQCQPVQPAPILGEQISLSEQCQPEFPQHVPSGEVALIGLRWQALTEIDQHYKISVQLLDARNQVIAQHDGEPGGGSQPTDQWLAGGQVDDNHGLLIPFGTPPGEYRLVVVVYDPGNGQRLSTGNGDFIELSQVQVTRTQRAIPLAIIPIQHRLDRQLGMLTLIGYTAYRKGYAHEPLTPLQAGDLVHFTFYWLAPEPLPSTWPDDQFFGLQLGNQTLDAPLAGGAYSTGQWQAGEVVRAEFDLPYDGSAHTPTLYLNQQRVHLWPLPR